MTQIEKTNMIWIAIAVLVVVGLSIFGYRYYKQHNTEKFSKEYLQNVAIGSSPNAHGVFSMPSFKPALDPRFAVQGVSGMRGGPSAPREMMPYSTSGASQYSAEEMISMGGCAATCGEGNVCKKMNCPFGNDYNEWATGSKPMDIEPSITMKSSGKVSSSDRDSDVKKFENAMGRLQTYQASVKAEEMLPKPDIAANVDPSQYVVYDRNMGSMMMKSGNRTPVDFIRGDVIPVTKNCTPTMAARIGDPDSPMFVPRFASDIGTLQRGYFTNYNDVVQVLEERNSSYFMTKAQSDRDNLTANSGMSGK